MSVSERERVHYKLLEALHTAKKQVESLEAALANNAAYLGVGVEREKSLAHRGHSPGRMSDVLLRSLGLVEREDDISDYIGREGDDASRPRLGQDAPDSVRPRTEPELSPLVGQLALGHPADSITFNSPLPGETSGVWPPPGAPPGPPSSPPKTEAARTKTTPPPSAASPAAQITVAQSATAQPVAQGLCPNTEEELRASLALEAINEGIWDWNLISGRVYSSPRWQAIVGPPPAEDVPPLDALVACLPPEVAEPAKQRFMELLDGRSLRLRLAVRLRRAAGPGWGLLRAAALREGEATQRITVVLADITEQREAELALRANSERLRILVEDSPDLLGQFDAQGRVLYASPNVERYFSAKAGDLVGKQIREMDGSGQLAFLKQSIGDVFSSGQPARKELKLVSPLVGEFLADCRLWPEFGVDGEVVSVSVLVRDMTYARQLARNYYALFNSMDDGFVLFEHVSGWEGGVPAYSADEFALVVMNPAFGRMFHLEPPDITGLRLDELLRENSAEWTTCLKQVLAEGHPVLHSLRCAITGNYYEISAYKPEEGRVACIVKDVTELHKIEQEIRLNEARLAALYRLSHMDAAPEESVVRYSLEQAVKLTGSRFGYLYVAGGHEGEDSRLYWSHELQSQERLIPAGEKLSLPWRDKRLGNEITRAEVVNVVRDDFSATSDQSERVQRYMLAPVMEDGRIVCLAGVANKQEDYASSDLRQLELFINGIWFHLRRRWAVQALTVAKEQAEAASRAKNEFLANVSHELRTPLNGILGMLQVLQQSDLSEEQREWVATANYSGRSLLRIISDILDFSRIEAGRLELASQPFDFSATVRSTLGMFIHQAEQKHIRFSLHLDERIPPLLLGDDARVRQIIFNLVGNAFKFTREGEISVRCSLLPYCKKNRHCIYLSVQDTGIGIAENKIDRMFHAFTQLDGSSTRRYAGAGLGLSIVQRLVKLMDGALAVESAPDQGTTIHCTLNFAEPENLRPLQGRDAVPESLPPLELLVVEDDQISLYTIRALLRRAGYEPVCVSDGRQAIEALKLHAFACIITDIQMPEMDGMELARRIREENTDDIEPTPAVMQLLGFDPGNRPALLPIPPDIPIVALTAHAMSGDKERFLGLGIDYYLAKPVTMAELTATLIHIGRQARVGREN